MVSNYKAQKTHTLYSTEGLIIQLPSLLIVQRNAAVTFVAIGPGIATRQEKAGGKNQRNEDNYDSARKCTSIHLPPSWADLIN